MSPADSAASAPRQHRPPSSGVMAARPDLSRCLPGRDRSGVTTPGSGEAGDSPPLPGRTFTLEFPPGMEILTGNSRLHWSARGRLVKALENTAWGLAKQLKLPRIERADVVVEYRPPAHRGPLSSAMIRDVDNLAPTGKALVDGITLAGVFPQDTAKHVRRVSYEFGPKSGRGQVLLHIIEVAP